jgi:hypothetical protein
VQALVIGAVLEWIYEKETDIITVIPEAWEFIPQKRNSPVKLAAIELIRKGAALRNFLWIDSQDLAGVDAEVRKQVGVWLLGVQREINEVKRTLAHIPGGVKKPRPDDIAMLQRGQFFACWEHHVVKVYVQPSWLSEDRALAVARGELATVVNEKPPQLPVIQEDFMSAENEARIIELLEEIKGKLDAGPPARSVPPTDNGPPPAVPAGDEDALYERILSRLRREAPHVLKVLASRPELKIEVETVLIVADGSSLRGRIARMLQEGFFKDPGKNGSVVQTELTRRGFDCARPGVYKECDALAEMGFLTKEYSGKNVSYVEVPDMKVQIMKK